MIDSLLYTYVSVGTVCMVITGIRELYSVGSVTFRPLVWGIFYPILSTICIIRDLVKEIEEILHT